MRKTQEICKDNSCWNKALPSELMFVLLCRDETAPDTIEFWANKRIELGLNKPDDPQIVEARECAAKMREERLSVRERVAIRRRGGRVTPLPETPANGQ
jgi:hypothetical protein